MNQAIVFAPFGSPETILILSENKHTTARLLVPAENVSKGASHPIPTHAWAI